jgi:hypothetical protein
VRAVTFSGMGSASAIRRMAVVLLASALALAAFGTSAARASGCTDSWTDAAGGDWFAPGNWSSDAPPGPEDEACIALSGTYTVSMIQSGAPVSVRSLTIGGAAGTQTLAIGACSAADVASLSTSAGIGNGPRGAIVLAPSPAEGETCGAPPGSVTLGGAIANAGSLTVEPVSDGALRDLSGDLTNTGTLVFEADTTFDGTGAKLLNEGAISFPAEAVLTVGPGESLENVGGGSIDAAGAGGALVKGEPAEHATFAQGAGSTSGAAPVIVDDGTLDYTGTASAHGAGPIVLRGSSTLSGNVQHGESLSVQATCAEEADVTVTEGTPVAGDYVFVNAGRLELSGQSCGRNIFFRLGRHFTERFHNYGIFAVENPYVGYFRLEDCQEVTNYGLLELDATPREMERREAPSLEFSCPFNQTASGMLRTAVASATEYGRMRSGAGGELAGILQVRPIAPFAAGVGQAFDIIAGEPAVQSGFEDELENPVSYTGFYYKPNYSSTGVSLEGTQVTVTRAPASGAPGALITVGGAGYGQERRGGQVTVTFTDGAGVRTVYPDVYLGDEKRPGEFSTQIAIPATAALGAAKIAITSREDDVHITQGFHVT